MKKKCVVGFLTLIMLILFTPTMMGAADLSQDVNLDKATDLTTQTVGLVKDGPYVKAYIQEHGSIADEGSETNNSKQRASDMALLDEFYKEDIEVSGIIKKYERLVNASGLEKLEDIVADATSLDKNKILRVIQKITIVYKSADETEKELLLGYLLRYRNCADSKSTEFINSLNNSVPIQAAVSYTYNINNATNYAHQWASYYNTAYYPALSNYNGDSVDCTNFVSQCLHAGGIPFWTPWYCYKKNGTYPAPANASQLNYSWDLFDPSPFTSARYFHNSWFQNVPNLTYSKDDYINNHVSIYNDPRIGRGDVVMFTSGLFGVLTWPVHNTIITYYDSVNKDYLYTAHSVPRYDWPVITGLQSGNYAGIEIYLF